MLSTTPMMSDENSVPAFAARTSPDENTTIPVVTSSTPRYSIAMKRFPRMKIPPIIVATTRDERSSICGEARERVWRGGVGELCEKRQGT